MPPQNLSVENSQETDQLAVQRQTVQKLSDAFTDWATSLPAASFGGCNFDPASKNYQVKVKFHRFNVEYAIPESTVQSDTWQEATSTKRVGGTIANAYYEHNYDLLFSHKLGERKRLTQDTPGCRFCSRTIPAVTFRKRAHAVPQSIGNKNLISNYECDECNSIFGDGIETQFGNFTLTERALFGISGQSGNPKYQGKERDGSIQVNQGKTEIKISAFSGTVTTDLDQNMDPENPPTTITLTLACPIYHPLATLKAYYKMALTLLPENELNELDKGLFKWIADADHRYLFPGMFTYLVESFHSHSFRHGAILLFRRKPGVQGIPYITLVLSFARFTHQIFIANKHELGSHKDLVIPYGHCFRDEVNLIKLLDLSTTQAKGVTAEYINDLAFELWAKTEGPACDLG